MYAWVGALSSHARTHARARAHTHIDGTRQRQAHAGKLAALEVWCRHLKRERTKHRALARLLMVRRVLSEFRV
jgi:hypothetical protein